MCVSKYDSFCNYPGRDDIRWVTIVIDMIEDEGD